MEERESSDNMGSIAELYEPDANGNNTVYVKSLLHLSGKNNIFKWMSLFFRENALLMRTNYSILLSMLEDFELRKGYTFPTLLGQLRDFCSKYESDNSRYFIIALLDINRKQSGIFESQYVKELVSLLWNEAGNFSDILGTICGKNPEVDLLNRNCESLREIKHQKLMDEFYYYLKHAASCHFQIRSFVEDGKEEINQVRLIDYPLNYGESPLMSASRHRKPDVILALLRHGAIMESNWMCYRSAVEVLILAPNLIYLSSQDVLNIEVAMQYFLRACTSVNRKHIHTLNEEGYSPLHQRWQHLIPEARYAQPCSLKQTCRVNIRNALNQNSQLPYGIENLPLPVILKEYLDLLQD